LSTLHANNKSCENKLPNEINTSTYINFKDCNCDQLTAFIHCRLFETAKKPSSAEYNGVKFKKVNKGSVALAIAGEDNLIARAMMLKSKPILLSTVLLDVEEPTVDDTIVSNSRPTIIDTCGVGDGVVKYLSVDELSKKQGWVDQVRSDIKGVVFQHSSTKIVQQAKDLVQHLFARMDGHILNRLNDCKYLDWWCFRWAKAQFSRVALISCLAGHVKADLQAMNEMDCLLTCIWSNFNVVEPESRLEGSYLVFDAVHGRMRRSGKASPVTIATRWYEKHVQAAKVSNKGWYGQFPHQENPNIRPKQRKGFFHQLQVFVALAFDRSNTSHLIDTSKLGIFEWDDETMDHIKKWKVTGRVIDKQLIMVSYLFELVYDMMISPAV